VLEPFDSAQPGSTDTAPARVSVPVTRKHLK